MAEVYYPDVISQPVEDSTSASFPRAPPPSPEMQPRGLGNIFEIPASKFDGIGLDLRRNSFSFDCDDDKMGGGNDNYTTRRKAHSCLFQDSDLYEEDDISCSPRKRVCCANNFLSLENHTTISSASCGENSFTSSGFGSYGDASFEGGAAGGYEFKTRVHVGKDAQNIGRPLSSHLSPDSMLLSKPQVMVPRVDEGVAVMRDPFSPSYYNEDHLQNAMSRSFDLHATHPHLPLSFETTQLPAVRPGRSRTLDTASLQKTLPPPPPHSDRASSSETNLDPSQRRRKISVKRKNPEESENDPLQFSFDYSYSSTGSGENDWVLVDRKPEGVWPSEKKPCGGDHFSILSHSRLQPYVFNGDSRPAPPLDVPNIPSFSNHKTRSEYSSVNASGNPLHQHNMENSMGFNLEDGEKMETDASTGSGPGIANLPLSNNSMAVSPSALLRPHRPPGGNLFGGSGGVDLLGVPSRHSCMEGFLHQQSRNGWWGAENTEEQVHMDTEVDIRLNFSKSL